MVVQPCTELEGEKNTLYVGHHPHNCPHKAKDDGRAGQGRAGLGRHRGNRKEGRGQHGAGGALQGKGQRTLTCKACTTVTVAPCRSEPDTFWHWDILQQDQFE